MEFTEGPKGSWTGFVTTKDRQSIRITVHRSIHHDPNAWFLTCPSLEIANSQLCSGQEFGPQMAQHFALRQCAHIAHDRADAITRIFFSEAY